MTPEALKNFLYDRTIYAVAALSLLANVFLLRLLLKSYEQRIADLRVLAPLTDKLSDLLHAGARVARVLESDEKTPVER